MTDVVIAFDNFGRPRDELPVIVRRSWSLTNTVAAAKGGFTISYSHTKANLNNLRDKNFIVVQSDQRGLQDYAALIDEPTPTGTEVIDGEYNMKLRSAEWILGTRYTAAQDIFTGKPGEIFVALLYAARREGFLPISTDTSGISFGGNPIGPLEYNYANVFEAINDLAEKNAAYWWLAPTIGTDNMLVLKPFFAFKRTRSFPIPLRSAGSGLNFVITNINQSGQYELANHVKAVGRAPEGGVAPEYEERDNKSIAFYRGTYTKIINCPDESTVEGLIPVVQAYIAESAFIPLQIDGIIVSAPFPRVGDIVSVIMQSYGSLITARRGPIVQMTIETATYNPVDNGLSVHLNELQDT